MEAGQEQGISYLRVATGVERSLWMDLAHWTLEDVSPEDIRYIQSHWPASEHQMGSSSKQGNSITSAGEDFH